MTRMIPNQRSPGRENLAAVATNARLVTKSDANLTGQVPQGLPKQVGGRAAAVPLRSTAAPTTGRPLIEQPSAIRFGPASEGFHKLDQGLAIARGEGLETV